jgi:hypothetical protein
LPGSGLSVIRNPARPVVVFLVLAVSCTLSLHSAVKEQRIRIKARATEARINGQLTVQNDEARYVLRANSGQRLTAELIGPGPFSATIESPSGKQEGQPGGGVFFDQQLTETGDYHIRISQGSRGEKRNVRFVLKIHLR